MYKMGNCIAFDRPERLQSHIVYGKEGVMLIPNNVQNEVFLLAMIAEIVEATQGKIHTVVDIGASIGFVSGVLARFGADHVWAFEANPLNYSYLVQNLHRHNSRARLYPFQVAVTDSSGNLIPLRESDARPEQSSVVLADQENQPIIALVLTLSFSDVLKMVGPEVTLLKIDIEGGEHLLFSSVEPELLRKVQFLHLEDHSLKDPRYIQDIPEVDFTAYLRDNRFEPTGKNPGLWRNTQF